MTTRPADPVETSGPAARRPLAAPGQRPEDRLPIRLLRAVNVLFARVYHQLDVQAPCCLPRKGPAILVCNHTSGLDPLFLQAPCNRLITWMMAAEYFDVRPLAGIFRTLDVIPVQRSGRDTAAMRAAMRALEQGRVLGIFPEGRIETSRELLPFQTGVALMAIKTGVPVYPAYLDGTQRGKGMLRAFLTSNRANVRYGPPVEFGRTETSRKSLENATDHIRQAILELQTASQPPC